VKLAIISRFRPPSGLVAVLPSEEVIDAHSFGNELLQYLPAQYVTYPITRMFGIVAFLKLKHTIFISKGKLSSGDFTPQLENPEFQGAA